MPALFPLKHGRVRSIIRRLAGDSRGATAVATGLAFVVLAGFAGLAVDVGSWETAKRRMQNAADDAAFAAAVAHAGGASDDYAKTTGKAVAVQMGFVDGGQTHVTINNPPASGSHSGSSSAWEAIVSQPQKMWFASVFLSAAPSASARAVAAPSSGPTTGACVISLDPSNKNGAITISGSGSATLSNCDVYLNSSNSTALTISGSASLVATDLFDYGGSNVSASKTATPLEITGTASVNTGSTTADPYHTVSASCAAGAWSASNTPSSSCRSPPPLFGTGWSVSASSCTVSTTLLTANQRDPTNPSFIATSSDVTTSGAISIYPGVYCGKLLPSGGHVTLNTCSSTNSACNNVYIVYKDFGTSGGSATGGSLNSSGQCNSASGNPYINGSGVTVFLYGSSADGHVAVSSGGCVSLTAPTSDTYSVSGCSSTPCGNAGLALWQPEYSSSSCAGHGEGWSGAGIEAITGAIYTPCNNMSFTGSSGSTGTPACTQLVALDVTISGGSGMNHSCSGSGISDVYYATTGPLRLVE